MKKNPLLLCGILLVILLLFPSRSMHAAPHEQSKSDDSIQIVLVLDSSGSMGTPVYSGIVPEDLLSLLLRMDELQNDPTYIELKEQMAEAENDPLVVEAKDALDEAYFNLGDWITSEYGVSLPGVQAMIRSSLVEATCDDTNDELISTAGNADQIMFYLNADCPASVSRWPLLDILLGHLPYINDLQYQTLREEWQTAFRSYNDVLEESGYTSYSEQLEEYKASGNFDQIQTEIDNLVELYNIPSRLELAKSAAINLIDYSKLDQEKNDRDSLIGLVTFSNQAMYKHGLTLNHEEIKPLIRAMVPLHQTNIGDALIMGLNELETSQDPDQPQLLILLSDGHANVGMSSSEILAVVPPRANKNDIIICTAGFADIETEVDFVLLEGLAYETNGEYLFTNSGAELGSFFTACREAAVGKELAGQLTGIVAADDFVEAGIVSIPIHTCELTLSLNFLSGMPMIELLDPNGDIIDQDLTGVTYQIRNQVQLLTVENPQSGEWTINLTNEQPQGEDAVYSLVASTNPCEGPPPVSKSESEVNLPYFVTEAGLSAITAGIVIVIVLLFGATAYVILIRQRKA
jgi:Mg-chelatase subunit ChlD